MNGKLKQDFKEYERRLKMNENQYSLAGWVAIAQAIIFPLALFMAIAQGLIGVAVFGYHGPSFGPSDLLFMLFTVMWAYTLWMFRVYLNERYDYHDLDFLITAAICVTIFLQMTSLGLRGMIFLLGSMFETVFIFFYLTFAVVAMVTAGILDILIAVKLLQIRQGANDLLKAFAYITMAVGILEVTIILSPLAFVLVPVYCVILGMIFLGKQEEVQLA
jgi:hypothetical protein